MSPKARFERRLRTLRRQRRLSQATLAARVGITQPYVSLLEAGRKPNPSLAVIRRLAQVLSVRVSALLD
jgi:XRE family transcriptional regulator of biofilm formation